MIIAPPGRVFVGADYSQLEMRIMAALSGDPELIRRCAEADENDKYNPERDPHAFVAAMTFGDTYVEAYHAYRADTTNKKAFERVDALRTVIKRTVYGLNYGSGAKTVLDALLDGGYEGPPLKLSMIERVIQTYFRLFQGVPVWRERVLREAAESRAIYSPILKRHRIFPLGDIDATVAYNFPIQSGAADIMNLRLAELAPLVPLVDPSAMLIAQVHDAIYIECAKDKAVEMAQLVTETLSVEWSIAEGAPSMPFPASAQISDNWKEAA